MTRSFELLKAAANEFANLRSPFETSWLSEHGVTLDECGNLSEQIEMAIRIFLALPVETRVAYATRAMFEEKFP